MKPGGTILQVPNAAAAARAGARTIAQALERAQSARTRASLALSGGNTPRAAYALLSQEPAIRWANVNAFWIDERAVPPDSDESNYRWAKEELLDHVSIPPANVHRMRADAADLAAAALDYEALLRAHVPATGGIPVFDVAVFGIGDDGHTASLFPGRSEVLIRDRTVVGVPMTTGRDPRMTLTAPVIESVRAAVVLVVGEGKRTALQRTWAPEGTLEETPARVLRAAQGDVYWIVDDAAAAHT